VILPTKGISADRALLSIGASLLKRLDRPKTVSRLWEDLRDRHTTLLQNVSYDWFVLALDLLFAIRAVEFEDGRLRRTESGE
jgi:hypothetical protein